MTIFPFESVLPVDLDGTLICWGKIKKGHKTVSYTCPYTKEQKIVRVHEPHLAVLRERLARGCLVVAWSKAGYAKVAAVLRALKIDHKNIVVMSKPKDYIDDMPARKWMGERINLDPDCGYGK
jgi:hypothetical protein